MEEKLKQMRRSANDLSDIVLEKESRKTVGTKKWLLTAASMLLLFLIILVIMKMLNKPDNSIQENVANVGESVETLVPDAIAESVEETSENLFKKEPIIDETSETDLKFEEMVRKLKEQDKIEEPILEKVAQATKKVLPTPTSQNTVPLIPSVKMVKPQVIQPIVDVVQEPVLPIRETIPYDAVPYEEPVVRRAPARRAAPVKPQRKYFSDSPIPSISGYFIQVGATAKSFPDRKFLTKIKRTGFDYIVHGVNIKGKQIKKVLVGPYNTRDAAKEALSRVKANINPSAYIYRIK